MLRTFVGALALLPTVTLAATRVVHPDGSGTYPTIQAAIHASANGDIVELSSGTFTGAGNREIVDEGRSVTIRSQSGNPSSCTIDCQSLGRAFSFEIAPPGWQIKGITIENGLATHGGAITSEVLDGVTIEDCVFRHNTAEDGAGAVLFAGSPTFRRCRFIENHAIYGGALIGELVAGGSLDVTIEDCEFLDNTAYDASAMDLSWLWLAAQGGPHPVIRNSTFAGNHASGGSAIILVRVHPLFEHCTFADNETGSDPAIVASTDAVATMDRCILAFSDAGQAVSCQYGGSIQLTCSDLFGNAGGDWVDCIADQADQNGNFSADPLFCDREGRDYRLEVASPCAPENNLDCGQVGAWPATCGQPVAVEPVHWGSIKYRYK